MKYTAALITALVATTSALPAPAALPEGFQPISRDEIMRRLETSAANPIEKRTPGGVRVLVQQQSIGPMLRKRL